MLSKYMSPRNIRRVNRTITGRFRGGKLACISAVAVRESESGSLSQTCVYELDPIAGRMITPITAEIISVYVPCQAIDAVQDPDNDYPGNSEVFRQKLLSGANVFPMEDQTEASKSMGIVPRRGVDGTKKVNSAARLAHIAAVNFLRREKYVKAAQLPNTHPGLSPALISQTVLERFNAVLDPEDRVNGAIEFNGQIPIVAKQSVAGDSLAPGLGAWRFPATDDATETEPHDDGTQFNSIYADLAQAERVTLSDFYLAERTDALTREMRRMVDVNPQYGEEIVARFAHGLSVDPGKIPFVLYRNTKIFGTSLQRAMDGPNLDVTQTNTMQEISFTVPVPPTEFGGVIITFAAVKPDERLASQPDPFLAETWSARNYVADEMAIDPVPVRMHQIDSNIAVEDRDNIAFYTGNNELLRNYVNYGFAGNLDETTVENKTAVWQLDIPLSVTPETVLYPADLDHYPFADNLADVCTYTIQTSMRINTPIIFGPTPVEELAAIETEDVFEDA